MKKKIVFLSIIISIIVISAFFLYSTYATDPVPSNDSYAITLTGDTTVSVPANSYKDIIYQVKNTNDGTVNYGVGYSSTTGDSIVCEWSSSTDSVIGTITSNEYKYVKIRIENNGNIPDTVTLSTILGYENGGELVVPNNVTIVTEKIYKVTFDSNGGNSTVYSKGVRLGTVYGNLPAATRDGYTFLGWSYTKNVLPSEYQEVEYIQSDGTQYINTGISYYRNTIYVDAQFLDIVGTNAALLGSGVAGQQANKQFSIAYQVSRGVQVSANNARSGAGCWNTTENIGERYGFDRFTLLSNKQNGNLDFNGVEYIPFLTLDTNQPNTIPMYLFAINQGGTAQIATSSMRLYQLTIWNKETGELQRDFIPCYSTTTVSNDNGVECPSGTIGLYDLVNGKFYTNANNDANADVFVAGDDVATIVNNNTIVEQATDHTLYAIWQEDNT